MASSLDLTRLALEITGKRAVARVRMEKRKLFVVSTVPLNAAGVDHEVKDVKIARKGLRNVLMDLDDTIIFNAFADRVFPQYIDRISSETGASPFRIKSMVYEEHYRYLSALDPRCFDWELIVNSVAKKLGVNLSIPLSTVQDEACSEPFLKKLDGADELLNRIRSLGLRIYVFSNGYSKYQAEALKRLGIYDMFDGMITPEELGSIKSSPDFYRGFSPEDTLVIGDNYFFDVEAPSELRFDTVWIYGRGKAPIGGFQFVEGKDYYFAPDARAVMRIF